ncbi:MAG: ChbG/HpnK family deacetylase [Erysipelotrichaceae bacterium]|nr:ChbG/HpnK family deacetylase [Erysipelotrichaceae bacterium]
MELLIRADDLGFSEAVNLGIAKTVHEGIIRNVGLMTNMPYSRHGYDLIKDAGVCLGQHTNISTGKPILDPERIPSLVDENGHFRSSRDYRSAKEDFVVLDEVIAEIEAQYEAFKRITGRKPDYFEGHAVASKNFIEGLRIVAEKHGLRFLNFSFKGEPIAFGNGKLHIVMESMQPDYDPLETLKKTVEKTWSTIPAIVFHPGFIDAYLLKNSSLVLQRAYETEVCCSEEVKAYLERHKVRLLTYNEVYDHQ